MNAPLPKRSILRHHVGTIEAKYPLRIVGLLPRGSAAHRSDERTIDFLGEKREGLTPLGLARAENDLADHLGRPVGIVLASEIADREARGPGSAVEQL